MMEEDGEVSLQVDGAGTNIEMARMRAQMKICGKHLLASSILFAAAIIVLFMACEPVAIVVLVGTCILTISVLLSICSYSISQDLLPRPDKKHLRVWFDWFWRLANATLVLGILTLLLAGGFMVVSGACITKPQSD